MSIATSSNLEFILSLLPGFLTVSILEAIAVRRKREPVLILVEALAFNLAIIASTKGLLMLLALLYDFGFSAWGTESQGTIAWTVFFSFFFAIIVGASITHDWHMKALRSLRITNRTSHASTWYEVFSSYRKCGATVTLHDNRRIAGYPSNYADDPSDGSICLQQAHWITSDGSPEMMTGSGVLIPGSQIKLVQFWPIKTESEKRNVE